MRMVEPISLQTVLTYLTLISVPVGVLYHIMTLRNTRKNQEMTLETRQAQLFMQIYNRWNSADFLDAWDRYASHEWSTYEEFSLVFDDPRGRRSIRILGTYFEGIGVLVKEDLIDIRIVAELMTSSIMSFWEKLTPVVEDARKRRRAPSLWNGIEYLYRELVRYTDEHPEIGESPDT